MDGEKIENCLKKLNSKFEFMRKLFLWNYLVGWASCKGGLQAYPKSAPATGSTRHTARCK